MKKLTKREIIHDADKLEYLSMQLNILLWKYSSMGLDPRILVEKLRSMIGR